MRYVVGFLWLLLVLFTFSCKDQKSDFKPSVVNQMKPSETKGAERRELAPLGKQGQNYIPGEILIKFKDGTDPESIKKIQKKLGLRTIKIVPNLNIHRMKIPEGASVEDVMKRLQRFKEVVYSEPNTIVDFK